MPTVGYTTTEELARVLNISDARAATLATQLTEVLNAAAGEIDAELDLAADAAPLTDAWQLALLAQVNIDRAVEHWHQREQSWGIVGLDTESPVRLARDTWDRHAYKLAPLKDQWGLA